MENIKLQEPPTTKKQSYGRLLAEAIRAKGDWDNQTDYEKFALENGYRFDTKEELNAGYDRLQKSRHDILITEAEFIAEITTIVAAVKNYNIDTLKVVYAKLANLVKDKKLQAKEVYKYAAHRWCIRDPKAIIACETEHGKWEVNNCDAQTTAESAKIKINLEWGFEASQIELRAVPYYDATDYQYIRFNCKRVPWLWKNGELYQVYED